MNLKRLVFFLSAVFSFAFCTAEDYDEYEAEFTVEQSALHGAYGVRISLVGPETGISFAYNNKEFEVYLGNFSFGSEGGSFFEIMPSVSFGWTNFQDTKRFYCGTGLEYVYLNSYYMNLFSEEKLSGSPSTHALSGFFRFGVKAFDVLDFNLRLRLPLLAYVNTGTDRFGYAIFDGAYGLVTSFFIMCFTPSLSVRINF